MQVEDSQVIRNIKTIDTPNQDKEELQRIKVSLSAANFPAMKEYNSQPQYNQNDSMVSQVIQPYESQISLIDGPPAAKDPIIEMANALENESK